MNFGKAAQPAPGKVIPMSLPKLAEKIISMRVRQADEPHLHYTIAALEAYYNTHQTERTILHAHYIQSRRKLERHEESLNDAEKLELRGLKTACTIMGQCEAMTKNDIEVEEQSKASLAVAMSRPSGNRKAQATICEKGRGIWPR